MDPLESGHVTRRFDAPLSGCPNRTRRVVVLRLAHRVLLLDNYTCDTLKRTSEDDSDDTIGFMSLFPKLGSPDIRCFRSFPEAAAQWRTV